MSIHHPQGTTFRRRCSFRCDGHRDPWGLTLGELSAGQLRNRLFKNVNDIQHLHQHDSDFSTVSPHLLTLQFNGKNMYFVWFADLWPESGHWWRFSEQWEDVRAVWADPQAAAETLHWVDAASVSEQKKEKKKLFLFTVKRHNLIFTLRSLSLKRFPSWYKLSFTPSKRMSLLNKYLQQLFDGPCKGVSSSCPLVGFSQCPLVVFLFSNL